MRSLKLCFILTVFFYNVPLFGNWEEMAEKNAQKMVESIKQSPTEEIDYPLESYMGANAEMADNAFTCVISLISVRIVEGFGTGRCGTAVSFKSYYWSSNIESIFVNQETKRVALKMKREVGINFKGTLPPTIPCARVHVPQGYLLELPTFLDHWTSKGGYLRYEVKKTLTPIFSGDSYTIEK